MFFVVIKNASNSHFTKHPISAANFDALRSVILCARERATMRFLGINDALQNLKRFNGAELREITRNCALFTRGYAELGRNKPLKCDHCA